MLTDINTSGGCDQWLRNSPVLSAMDTRDMRWEISGGGLSIALPMVKYYLDIRSHIINHVLFYSAIWIIGLAGIFLGARNINGKIREREAALAELEKSEFFHKSIIKTALDGFWIVDLKGNIREVNDRYCRMSGYEPEELSSMKISDIEVAETEDETKQHIQKIVEQGYDRFESKHRIKDGEIIDVEISTQYLKNQDVFVAFIRDVTEKLNYEQNLQKNQMRLVEAQSVAKLGHYNFYAAEGTWTCSDALDQIFGIDNRFTKDVNGWVNIIHPDHKEMMLNYLQD